MKLIDADAFERAVMFDPNVNDMQDVIYALRDYPAVDVEPVRHGKWLPTSDGEHGVCQICGMNRIDLLDGKEHNYCEVCGAKMDGDNEVKIKKRVNGKWVDVDWIPVSAGLPKEDGEYLVTMEYFKGHDRNVSIQSFSNDLYTVSKIDFEDKHRPGWYGYDYGGYGFFELYDVIAWKPLPKPYEGEK